jgi:predicted nucleic acid-binding protein
VSTDQQLSAKPRVYIETTVVSYLTARPSRDIVVVAHQQITRDWWQTYRSQFELVTSQLVIQEASAGNTIAARERLDALDALTRLEITEEARALAQKLVREGAVPTRFGADALHIAVAVVNGIEYLLTWNCTHLANATMRPKIEGVCRSAGYEPAIICTPEELMAEVA